MEGPFGEYLGHVNGAAPAAVVEITAITRRAAALHHGFVQQMPPSDGHLVMEIGMLGPLWFNLTRKLGVKGIRNLAIARGSAGLSILVAQIERAYASESSRIGRLLAKFNSGQKFIYLVDEDIDIRDQETLNWALSSRVNAPQDVAFVESFSTHRSTSSPSALSQGEQLVPAVPSSSVVVINAMSKGPMAELSLPDPSMMCKVLDDWAETGLPPLCQRRRLKRFLGMSSV